LQPLDRSQIESDAKSVALDEIEDGDAGATNAETPVGSSSTRKVQWDTSDKEGAYHGHGAAQGSAGENLEWFTVLAEYPNRPQLTRIHNAISCVMGNFDAVVRDQRLSPGLKTEGCTSFGLFDFEANAPDETQHEGTERLVMSALERLPWIHDSTFEAIHGRLPEEQRAIVRDIRENWVLSSELEASLQVGGPAWLVEARAHAMFVPSEPPAPPPLVPRSDPVITQILYQHGHGNISSGQVRLLFESHMEDLHLSSPTSRNDTSGIWRKSGDDSSTAVGDFEESSFSEFTKFDDFSSAFSNISTNISKTVVHPGQPLRPNLSELKDRNLDAFHSAYETLPTTLVRPGSRMSFASDDDDDDDDDDEDDESEGTMRTGISDDGSTTAFERRISSFKEKSSQAKTGELHQTDAAAVGGAVLSANNSGLADDRINRMEGLMEQLVIFNSQLALMKGPSLADNTLSPLPHRRERNADQQQGGNNAAIQQELYALRNQLEKQSTKEEATNEILLGLREELANIRTDLVRKDDDSTIAPRKSSKSVKQSRRKSKKLEKKEKKQKAKKEKRESILEIIPEVEGKKEKRSKRGSMRWLPKMHLGHKKKSGTENHVLQEVKSMVLSEDGDGATSSRHLDIDKDSKQESAQDVAKKNQS